MGIVAILTFLLVSPTVASAFASPLTAISNRTLVQNNDGVIILEGATVIDGTGNLPKPNTTIVIDGNRIVFVSNHTADSFLNFSAAKSVNLTCKYIIPGLFDMHAHVGNVLKD